jgi:hypothetical protein
MTAFAGDDGVDVDVPGGRAGASFEIHLMAQALAACSLLLALLERESERAHAMLSRA